jgi:xanthine dehydrogenase molybdopterin-binding subunit B
MERSDYFRRRASIEIHNAQSTCFKKGIAMVPVKFGISFTTSFLNQAGSLIHIYQDGSVVVNHGGTEMGQGLHTKILQIAAKELGISHCHIRVEATNTAKVPNTSATAASSGTDLNGMAVKNGIAILKQRLCQVAVDLYKQNHALEVPTDSIVFDGDELRVNDGSVPSLLFKDVVLQAYLKQVSLSTTGYYKTPGIFWDKEKGKGTPFFYFAYGMAVSEVMVDTLTGHVKLVRADILHDVGNSINTAIDLGQVRGAFIQGVGWVTTEDVKHTADGRLLNASPDTYKIPVMSDIPVDFRVELLEPIENTGVIHGSKAVGEPPFVLGLSVWLAIRHAIGSTQLGIPATNEAILLDKGMKM